MAAVYTIEEIMALVRAEVAKLQSVAKGYSAISAYKEAMFAADIGFDLVATTLVGYTSYTTESSDFDYALLDRMVGELGIPIIAEGHLRTPAEAARALEHGAFSVVVGKAITMPSEATRWFAEAISKDKTEH